MEDILTEAVARQRQLAQLADSDALGQIVLLHPLAQIPVLGFERLIGHQGAGTAKAAAIAALTVGFELQVTEIAEQGRLALDELAVDHHADPDVVVHEHQHRIGAVLGGPPLTLGLDPGAHVATHQHGHREGLLQGGAERPVAQIVEGEVLDHAGVALHLPRQTEGDAGEAQRLLGQEALDGPHQAGQQVGALPFAEDMAMTGERAAGQIEQRHVHIAAAKAHGEKLEAALVDAQQGLAATTPHRALATGDHQAAVEQLAGDLGDAGRREAGQAGEIGTGQLLVLLQAGVDQAIVELTDQIDTAFHDLIHRVRGKG